MAKHETLTAALAAFQADLPKIGKGSINPHFKSRYADLADVNGAVLPALAAQGIAVVMFTEVTEAGFILRGELRHESGEWIGADWQLPDPTQAKAQDLGSALTYGRRYLIQVLTGVAPDEDDDGNAAQNAPAPRRREVMPADVWGAWQEQIASAESEDALRKVFEDAKAQGVLTVPVPGGGSLQQAVTARKRQLSE